MTYEETVAVVYRIVSAYPSQTRHLTEDAIEDMAREWHIGMANLPSNGVMEAITMLVTQQKWMPSLSEVISKILDVQYGADHEIIRELDNSVAFSSTCMIFGQVTEDQVRGYENLSPFQKLIIRSPYEFSMWMMKDYEWKEERVLRVKREIQYGGHKAFLNGGQNSLENNFDVFKALEERKNGNQQ